jgi:Protein of unknown function (DUF1161)
MTKLRTSLKGPVTIMTKLLGVCVLALIVVAPAFAQRKACDELKAEIAAKLDAKGVKGYQLDVVAAGEAGDRQVVGTCDGGEKKITYQRDGASKSPSK